ncbi:MAG: RNA methyltransferase [Anaerolineales bacterium]|nr:RNA methyltransferase [Anaerolineales bacterium]MCB8954049.1 RNA methyltransferase [Ardenticatenales bacterium]
MITSHRNTLVKRIKRLRQRKYRQQEQAFFVEGPRAFLAAVETGARVESVVYCRHFLRSEICYTTIAALERQGVPCLELSAEVFAAVAERENPAGIGAIITAAHTPLHTLSVQSGSIFVALVEAADPGNVGAILRTLDAVGGAGLILIGQTTDPFHPTAVKASMGSLFTVPLCEVATLAEVLDWARQCGARVVATSAHAPQDYWSAPLTPPLLLLMGSERHGLDPATLAAADLSVSIPMHGSVTSLNLSIATSLLLYEVARQQRPSPDANDG